MNIYKVSQDLNNGYDTYDSMVVAARDEQDARNIHPSPYTTHVEDGKWMGTYAKTGISYEADSSDWIQYWNIHKLTVELIGKAAKGIERGVILASFNAG